MQRPAAEAAASLPRVVCIHFSSCGGSAGLALKALGMHTYDLSEAINKMHGATHPKQWLGMFRAADRLRDLSRQEQGAGASMSMMSQSDNGIDPSVLLGYEAAAGLPTAHIAPELLKSLPSTTKFILVEDGSLEDYERLLIHHVDPMVYTVRYTSNVYNPLVQAWFPFFCNLFPSYKAEEGQLSEQDRAKFRADKAVEEAAKAQSDEETPAAAGAAASGKTKTANADAAKKGGTVSDALELFERRAKLTIPSNRLLVFRPADGHGWEELCKFLNVSMPSSDVDFPVFKMEEEAAFWNTLHTRQKRALYAQNLLKAIYMTGLLAILVGLFSEWLQWQNKQHEVDFAPQRLFSEQTMLYDVGRPKEGHLWRQGKKDAEASEDA